MRVKPKKHLGQHFLKDQAIAQRIVDGLGDWDTGSPVLEIGPGTGVLTQFLLEKYPRFLALDMDEESIAFLHDRYPAHREKFRFADFLESDLPGLFRVPFAVIGNFPYNISSQIMFRVLDHKDLVPLLVGMFQKEVAERIASPPGNKTYGILSVLLQAHYDIDYLFTVHENVFDPPPKVKSAVIRLKRNPAKDPACDHALFRKVVKTAFNQRRKMLRNSISSLLAENAPAHPLLTRRPEQLSVQEFTDLTLHVAAFSRS